MVERVKAQTFYYMSNEQGMCSNGSYSDDSSEWVVYSRAEINSNGCKRPENSVRRGDYFACRVIDTKRV